MNKAAPWVREGAYDFSRAAAASSTDPVVLQQQYNVLAGHVAQGVDDNYIRRNKRMVIEACRAIENYYFKEG